MSELIELALLPFLFPFMQQAFLIAILVSLPTALLSTYLVLKGWSLMGDAISHAVLPGIVLAYMAAIPLAVGAFGAGMIAAISTGYITENSRVKQDTVMGVVFSGMFALGLILYTRIRAAVHLDHILFGDMLGVSSMDLLETGVIAFAVVLFIVIKGRDLLLFTFDPLQAASVGISTRFLHYGLLTILSLSIVAALKAVGIILAIALLISPGAIAFLITRRFVTMQIVAVVVAVGSALIGIYLSFFLDSAPAPTIVLVLTANFLLAFAYTSIRAAKADGEARPIV